MTENKINEARNNIVVESNAGTMNEKGTGIGLHMCYNLVHANHGSMKLKVK